ncbi:Rab family GTPase [Pseudanabaena sp. PCC 6802]|uniref:Rab family GTPase n=1 Tax=Pseudanabaena sp. PCC 6802 TaxID=118173 RepID=UPI00034DE5C5|nr:Rab family GTPase [Pseudanabaena sp. PCC 6802]
MSAIAKKICLVGDFGVGKTSLIRRFVDRSFSDRYLSTVGVKISRKLVELSGEGAQGSTSVQLVIWDLEGDTKFKAISATHLQGASGIIIVSDVTRYETVENARSHIDLCAKIDPKSWVVVALNKADLIDAEQMVKFTKLCNFTDRPLVIGTYQTSAKTGEAVDLIFQQLAAKMILPA